MATRFYLHRSAAPASPAPQGAWDDASTVNRAKLGRQKDTLASATIQRNETSADTAWDVLLCQYVSDQLDTAQTISGTFTLCQQFFESNADADMFPHVHVWVAQSDGSLRGTLLADYIDAAEFATTETGIQIATQTLSSVNAQVGDRIVVEVGFRAANSTTLSRSGRLRHGGNDATDASNGDTNTAHPAWCEFSHDFQDAETRVNWPAKWYLGGSTQDATAMPPLIRGNWTATASAAGPDQLRTATPGVASSLINLSMGATTQNITRLLGRFVSAPLNAGTIETSTVRITGIAAESAADQDIVWCMHLYLMKPSGDVRATLLNMAADPDADNEWPTTAAGRQSDEFTIAGPVTIEQDDRLVLEVGGKQLGTPAAIGNINIRQGGTGADAQVDDTDTTKPTWLGVAATAQPTRRTSPVWVGL